MHRRVLFTTAALAFFALSLVAGSVVAMRAAGPAETTFTLGRVESRVEPAVSGRFDAYVPIVDWGVRAKPYRGPLGSISSFARSTGTRRSPRRVQGPPRSATSSLIEGELRQASRRAFGARRSRRSPAGSSAASWRCGDRRLRAPASAGSESATGAGAAASVVLVLIAGFALVSADWSVAATSDLLRPRLRASQAPVLLRSDPHRGRYLHGLLRPRGRGAREPHLGDRERSSRPGGEDGRLSPPTSTRTVSCCRCSRSTRKGGPSSSSATSPSSGAPRGGRRARGRRFRCPRRRGVGNHDTRALMDALAE